MRFPARRLSLGLAVLAALAPSAPAATFLEPPLEGPVLTLVRAAVDALPHTNVVLVECLDAGGSRHDTGSGVFVGLGADGATGFVLTSAHLFHPGPRGTSPTPIGGLTIRFSAKLSQPPVLVRGTRVHLHPQWVPQGAKPGHSPDDLVRILGQLSPGNLVAPILAYYESLIRRGFGSPYQAGKLNTMPSHDLALVEFPVRELTGGGDRIPVQAAEFYTGAEALQGTLVDGTMVGYGYVGTTRQKAPLSDLILRHAGRGRVAYCDFGDWRGFVLTARLSELGLMESLITCHPTCPTRFLPTPTAKAFLNPLGGSDLACQTVEGQAVPQAGDSGGPLFLAGPGGRLQLAGLIQGGTTLFLQPADGKGFAEPCRLALFVPLWEHLPWIETVMKGQGEVPEGKAGSPPPAQAGTAGEHRPMEEDTEAPVRNQGVKRGRNQDPGAGTDPASPAEPPGAPRAKRPRI